jgi:pyruvate formate lyase activating enzyme
MAGKIKSMDELRFPLLALSRLRMGTDGKGVTTLAAGAGCPLSCRYCINRRLLKEAPQEFVTAEELLERVRIDDLYFRATGGGVTFGGGESLLHAEFICRFRDLCPPEWRIAAETSLAVPREHLLAAMSAVDEFIVDCKDMDPDIYRRYTGGDVRLMKDNLEILLASCGAERLLVRVPYIPGFNTAEDQARSAEALREMGVMRLELFDYVVRAE